MFNKIKGDIYVFAIVKNKTKCTNKYFDHGLHSFLITCESICKPGDVGLFQTMLNIKNKNSCRYS
jgi:hypothetical protein